MGMMIDDLKKECQYCCREIDNSGLEGFRCTNRTAIKVRDSSWCYPKNANEPCSICEYCEPKQDMEMTIDKHKEHLLDIMDSMPDDACGDWRDSLAYAIDTMRKYQMMQADYEARLKADMVAMLAEVLDNIEGVRTAPKVLNNETADAICADIAEILRAKINKLKGEEK